MEDNPMYVSWRDLNVPAPTKPVPASTPPAAGDVGRYVTWADTAPSSEMAAQERLKGGAISPMGASIINGLLMGSGPSIISKVRSITTGMPEEEALKAEKAQLEQFRKNTPGGSLALEMGSSLLPTTALLGATKAGVKAVAPKVAEWFANSGLGRYLATIAGGAGIGGLYGANSAPNNEVLSEAGKGAAYGAVGAAVLHPAIAGTRAVLKVTGQAASPTVQAILDSAGITNPNDQMAKLFSKKLVEGGQTEESVLAAMLDTAKRHPDKPIVLGDFLAPPAMGLIKAANNVSGPGNTAAKTFHDWRTGEMAERAMDDISATISSQPSELLRKQATAEAYKKAKPLYDRAIARGDVHDQDILDLFDPKKGAGQFFKPFLESVDKTQTALGEPLSAEMGVAPDGSFVFNKVPSMQDLHTIKQRLDDKITSALKPTSPSQVSVNGVDYSAQDLLKLKKLFLEKVDAFAPEYREARDTIAGDYQVDNGFDIGKHIFKVKPDEFAAAFDKLNEAGKGGARAGVASLLTDKALSTGTTAGNNLNLLNWMNGTPRVRRAIEHVFESPDQMQKYLNANEVEKLMARHSKDVELGLKMPDLNSAETGAGNLPALLASAFTGRTGMVIGGAKQLIGAESQRMTPAYADVMSDIGRMETSRAEPFLKNLADANKRRGNRLVRSGLGALGKTYGLGIQALPSTAGAMLTKSSGGLSKFDENNQ